MQNPVKEMFEEFKKTMGLCTDGYCPECEILRKKHNEMRLNKGDLFECPECNLMISMASSGRATILRRRGKANFKSLEDPYYKASRHIRNINLSREDPERIYESDDTFFKDEDELRSYLKEIEGVDPFV